jgi:hypothetical protein
MRAQTDYAIKAMQIQIQDSHLTKQKIKANNRGLSGFYAPTHALLTWLQNPEAPFLPPLVHVHELAERLLRKRRMDHNWSFSLYKSIACRQVPLQIDLAFVWLQQLCFQTV